MRRPRGSAELAPDARHDAEAESRAPAAGIGHREHGVTGFGCGVGPFDRGDIAGVDGQDREVTVEVGGSDLGGLDPAVGEGHLGLFVPDVVGVGGDEAGSDDHAAASTPDTHDGGAGGEGDLVAGVGEFIEERGHGGKVTCKSQVANHQRKSRIPKERRSKWLEDSPRRSGAWAIAGRC